MAKSLGEFVEEVREELEAFEKMWRENNMKDPTNWPLVIGDENGGLWWEFFWDERSVKQKEDLPEDYEV